MVLEVSSYFLRMVQTGAVQDVFQDGPGPLGHVIGSHFVGCRPFNILFCSFLFYGVVAGKSRARWSFFGASNRAVWTCLELRRRAQLFVRLGVGVDERNGCDVHPDGILAYPSASS